jgi:hypothetical protein
VNREMTTLSLPDITARAGLEVVGSSVAQFQQLQERDVVKWGDAVKRSGAVVE